jgi:anti-sigma factor RsiW
VSEPTLTCQELVELVTDYLEGRLAAEERRRFEDHLAGCAGCQAYVEQMRALVEELGRMPEPEVPAGLQDELLAAFRDWRASRA